MKKLLSVIFALIVMLTLLTGCNESELNDSQIPDGTSADGIENTDATENNTDVPTSSTVTPASSDDYIKNYDKEQFFPIGDSETEGFLLKGKKYEYYGNDVLIVKVENHTDTAYSIKMRVTYYDESGEKIRSTNKNFEGFAAGWENYLVFQPNTTFASFDYEFGINEFTGTAYSGYINTKECGGKVQGELLPSTGWIDPHGQTIRFGDPHNRWTVVHIEAPIPASSEENLYVAVDCIVFDNKGELYYINTMNQGILMGPHGTTRTQPIYGEDILWQDKDKFVWPEEITGDIYCIIGIKAVDVEPLV